MPLTAFSSARPREALLHLGEVGLADAAGVAGVAVVHLVLSLVAGHAQLLGVDHDDVVAGVDVRGVDGLVLAAQAARSRRPGGRALCRRRRRRTSSRWTSCGLAENVFMHFHFVVTGRKLKPEVVERAINLSAEKYCSATIILAKTAEVTHDYEIVEVDAQTG
jgi:hypothetical protein